VTYIEIHNGVSGYWRVLDHVLRHGQERSPRGKKTLDAGHVTVVTHDTSAPLPLGVGRNLSVKIAAAEAVQLIGAFSHPELLVRAAKNFENFLELDTGRFHGAYGERINDQLCQVVGKLRRDPDTRQAVITLWEPWRDNLPDKRDYPCTVALTFAIVRGALELSVFMRSQDIWWGTPYDWFQFSQLQRATALTLDVPPGRYFHTTVSTHIYSEFIPDAEIVAKAIPPLSTDREYQPDVIGLPGLTIDEIRGRAIHLGSYRGDLPYMTDSERWYQSVIASILG
jgi:thymidylate synthase